MIVMAWLALVIAMIWAVLTGHPGRGAIALVGALTIASGLWLAGAFRGSRT